jgi:hypothetical protein
LLAEITFAAGCYEIIIDIQSTLCYWDDVIDGVCIHAAPITFTTITIENA